MSRFLIYLIAPILIALSLEMVLLFLLAELMGWGPLLLFLLLKMVIGVVFSRSFSKRYLGWALLVPSPLLSFLSIILVFSPNLRQKLMVHGQQLLGRGLSHALFNSAFAQASVGDPPSPPQSPVADNSSDADLHVEVRATTNDGEWQTVSSSRSQDSPRKSTPSRHTVDLD